MSFVSLVLAATASLVGLLVTGLVRNYAIRHQVLDHPNARSSHAVATPRGGGIGFLAATLVTILTGMGAGLIETRFGFVLVAGMVAIGLVGWIDDRSGLPVRIRLFVHVLVAVGSVVAFGGLPEIRLGTASAYLGPLGHLLAIAGIVWSINLFNFMDGIDGMAGIEAVLVFGAAATMTFLAGDTSLGTSALILTGASAGFLAWNWPPAKIFLGDVGSGAMGYLVGTFALAAERSRAAPLLAFAIVGGVFVLDATLTLLRRLARREKLAEAHRGHAYQRLARAWGSHRFVSLASAGLTAVLAILAVVVSREHELLLPGFFAAYFLLATLYVAIHLKTPL